MLTALSQVEAGGVRWEEQDDAMATYAHKLEKHELNISPDDTVVVARRKQQASSVAHPCKIFIAGKNVTLLDVATMEYDDVVVAHVAKKNGTQADAQSNRTFVLECGKVALQQKKLYIGFSDGALEVKLLKPDGKREMTGAAFAAGIQGIKLGNTTWSAIDV